MRSGAGNARNPSWFRSLFLLDETLAPPEVYRPLVWGSGESRSAVPEIVEELPPRSDLGALAIDLTPEDLREIGSAP
jgi:hypothetical protein